MDALDKLIEAVEAGAAERDHFYDAFPGVKTEIRVTARNVYNIHSLNAALALHEALLPGWFCQMSVWSMHEPQIAKVTVGNDYIGTAPTPARAWLLAVLRAYRSTQPSNVEVG